MTNGASEVVRARASTRAGRVDGPVPVSGAGRVDGPVPASGTGVPADAASRGASALRPVDGPSAAVVERGGPSARFPGVGAPPSADVGLPGMSVPLLPAHPRPAARQIRQAAQVPSAALSISRVV